MHELVLRAGVLGNFYVGYFVWGGVEYKGKHEPLIAAATFDRVQRVFSGHNKPKYRKHDFAFAGLLRCAHDGCTVTTELQKKKYVYYRCSHGRGKCDRRTCPSSAVSDRLGDVLRGIRVPDHVARAIVESVENDHGSARRSGCENCQRRNSDSPHCARGWTGCTRTNWTARSTRISGNGRADWRTEERALQSAADSLDMPLPENRALTAQRILELANKAYFLYLTRNPAEQANC